MPATPERFTRSQIAAEVERMRASWPAMPAVTVVDSVTELPCKQPSNCDGLYRHGPKDVFVVASNVFSMRTSNACLLSSIRVTK